MLFSSCLRNWKKSLDRRAELRRARRTGASNRRTASRLFLERLEDRRLLSAQIFNYNPTLTEYSGPAANSGPDTITTGPDGNLWYTDYNYNAANIGRITPSGSVSEFPAGLSRPIGGSIITGPNTDDSKHADSVLWAYEDVNATNPVALEMTTDGVVTHTFPLPGANSSQFVLGPDNNVWFTEYVYNKIGYITPDGQVTEFNINFPAYNIIWDQADGSFWIGSTGPGQYTLARIAPNSTDTAITENDYSFAGHGAFRGLAVGSDGNLWVGEPGGGFGGSSAIDRIDPTTGQMTGSFSTPTPNSQPYGLVAGPDGAIWFAEINASQMGRITTDGIITEYSTPTPNSGVEPPTLGPDGNIWFAEYGANQIGEVVLYPQQSQASPPVTQSAIPGISQIFNLGSFTDPSATGPWTVQVNWGDSTTDTTFNVSSTGLVGTQTHAYATEGVYTVTEIITNTTDMTDTATAQFQVVVGPLVINTNSGGPGSLYAAIDEANEYPSLTNNGTIQADITFNIPTTDPGYNSTTNQFTINTMGLPTITEPVLLDGFSQPGASPNTNAMGGSDPSDNAVRLIVLDGSLSITGANSAIRGLKIQNASGDGIDITGSGASGNVVEGNSIDVLRSGINVTGSNNTIGGTDPSARNIIAASGIGIVFGGDTTATTASGNLVEGNYIGLDNTGKAVHPGLGGAGIVFNYSSANTIGGTTTVTRNVISGWGFQIVLNGPISDENTVEGNYIGTDATGALALFPNQLLLLQRESGEGGLTR